MVNLWWIAGEVYAEVIFRLENCHFADYFGIPILGIWFELVD